MFRISDKLINNYVKGDMPQTPYLFNGGKAVAYRPEWNKVETATVSEPWYFRAFGDKMDKLSL